MNCISNLARKNLKNNKVRNILTILSITLAACLIMSIGILCYSIQGMSIENAIQNAGGNYHAIYSNIDEKQLKELKNNIKIEKIGESIPYTEIKSKNKNMPDITLSYYDSQAATLNTLELEKGSLPQKANEIAMESWVLAKFNAKPRVGETVHTKLGDFVLCGILKDNDRNKKYQSFSRAVVSKALILKTANTPQLACYITVKNKSNIKNIVNQIAENTGIKNNNVEINTIYIEALGLDMSLIIPAAVVGIIVMLAAAMVIYNIFYISINQRIHQFGLLKAIGATKKQIKQIIIKEGLLLSAIGIPAGILMGFGISYIIIPLFSVDDLKIKASPYIVLIAVIVTLLTTIISIRKPMKLAAKISPVEAIGFGPSKNSNRKKERKAAKRISIYRIAYLNIMRNKKRTIITMLSLTMSGILFITMCTIFGSLSADNLLKQDMRYEFTLTMDGADDASENNLRNVADDIRKIDGVQQVNTQNIMYAQETEKCGFYCFSDGILNSLKKHIIAGKIDTAELKNNNEVIILFHKNKDKEQCKYKVGDKIKLHVMDIKALMTGKKVNENEFTVAGIVNRNFNDMGSHEYDYIAHEDTAARVTGNKAAESAFVTVDKNKVQTIANSINKILSSNKNIECEVYSEYAAQTKKQYKGIEIAAMSLVGIIGLIGLLNLINTILTSIIMRKKEFGMLQAVGLSNSQLRKMLQIEGLYYIVTSVILSITIGSGLGYMCYLKFKETIDYAQYQIQLVPVIILTVSFIAVEALVSLIAHSSINKDSIIDRIRYNE